jgi:UDP-N-acetyl-D-mannosaminuronic acid dehydrogenase
MNVTQNVQDTPAQLPRLCMLGLGYVGLPSAAVFADAGLKVLGVDTQQSVVDTVNSGAAHIVETNLDDLLKAVVGRGQLVAATRPGPADVFAIAVPTPFKQGKVPDLRFVESATRMIAEHLVPGNLVILESTSPVGTTARISEWLAECRPDLVFPHQDAENCDIHLAHCPERILPGKVLYEVVHNDRVIGGMTPRCSELAARFYKHAVKGACHITNDRTAELCKLSENAFRDVNIAFANELSLICDRLDVNVWELIALTNKHPRVDILRPGPGVGGHCIAVDPWFIVDSAPEQARLIATARQINDGKPECVAHKVEDAISAYGGNTPRIACMGLAYKPDVDDLRESPSCEVVALLSDKGHDVLVCEPFVEVLPESLARPGVSLVPLDEALDADIIVFLTAHQQFRAINFGGLQGKVIVDPVGLLPGPA